MKKSILIIVGFIVISMVSVFSTVAYLTDQDEVSNTYTIGNVNIKLDEANVDELGKLIDEDRVKENSYHLMPGYAYVKDPVVTVLKDSEDSYIRILITINNIDALKDIYGEDFTLEDIYSEWNENWIYSGVVSEEDINIYEYRYKNIVNGMNGDMKLEPIFKKFMIPNETTVEQLSNIQDLEVNIIGQAIQTAGFDSVDSAWKVFVK